jgi:hypothetical protein
MANPLPNEDELYERIKKEKITIHPVIWELLTHHIGNDLSLITMPLQSVLDPLHPKPITAEKAKSMFEHAMLIKGLIEKLRDAIGKGGNF